MRLLNLFRVTIWKELCHHPWLIGAFLVFQVVNPGITFGSSDIPGNLLPPLLAFALGVFAIRDERKEKALAVQFTRPVRRENWLFLKFASLAVILLVSMIVGAVITDILAWFWRHSASTLVVHKIQIEGIGSTAEYYAYLFLTNIFFLIAGLFADLWEESVVGRVRKTLVVLALLAAVWVVSGLLRIEGVTATILFEAGGLILLGASLGFVRQLQVRG